jgi:ferredoxin
MRIASREEVAAWLDTLCQQRTVIGPRLVEEVLLYRPVASSSDVVFDFQRAAMSPKTHLLPGTEVLLEIEMRGNEVVMEDGRPPGEQVLFGVRPCDAQALSVLDALLVEHEPSDAYFAERREKTTLVGLACPQLWPECFCTSVGGAPDDSTHVDVMLYEEDGGYLVEAITEKGAGLLETLASEETKRKAPASDASGQQVPVPEPEAWPALFNEVYWQRLSERCLSCHACTYVCPTCRCFDVRDYITAAGPAGTRVERLRSWDSCMASAYRRIAGGHNPRPQKVHRLRNRYYCKFNYCPQDFGALACVGCGRCIAVCPVGVDIAEMLEDVAALAAAAAGEGGSDD